MKARVQILISMALVLGAALLAGNVWLTANVVAEQARLEDALCAYGRDEYAVARRALERHARTNPQTAAMLYFYIGDCNYKLRDYATARKFLELAFDSPFNKDEAALRLIALCERDDKPRAAQPYRDYIAQQRKKYEGHEPPVQWATAQPQGKFDPEEPLGVEPYTTTFWEYSWGRAALGNGLPSLAAWWFENCAVKYIPEEEKFDSEWARRCYTKLAKAYRQKADLFALLGGDPEMLKAATITTRRYLDERRAVEIPEAAALAEHYRLKALIVETRLEMPRLISIPFKTETAGVSQ
jgi:hypothetical protein